MGWAQYYKLLQGCVLDLEEMLTSVHGGHSRTFADEGPFDARRVNFEALNELTSTQSDFDVHFPSRTAWKEFTAKWKNLSNFYIVDVVEISSALEDPVGTNAIHADRNKDNECIRDDE
ncbi:hypothetical protein PVK06_034939 [Gossypium arboreum]|uniref:Uncharacterized protein n=1 Tax=Gossypium arboreum TaxID=29729 RepID=A0ABR0NFJ1_GOSAR|nr:hypothetical protein PVK06_034939 [Gossypium arboreum]